MRNLSFHFRWPGLIEAVAEDPHDLRAEIETEGYQDSGIFDLQVEVDEETQQSLAWTSSQFDQNYPLVIWGLKQRLARERFNVPQAELHGVPLYEAFSWAYFFVTTPDLM